VFSDKQPNRAQRRAEKFGSGLLPPPTPDRIAESVPSGDHFRWLGFGMASLGISGLIFTDLTWVRVFAASLLFLLGLSFILRAYRPNFFFTPSRGGVHWENGLLVRKPIPPQSRWSRWALCVSVSIAISAGASIWHYKFSGGLKTQPVVSIPIALIRQVVREEYFALWSKDHPKPPPQGPPAPLPQAAKTGRVQVSLVSSFLSLGTGSCSFFMSISGANQVTPLPIIVNLRMVSTLDYAVYIDSYSMDLSKSLRGPWTPTRFIPIGFGTLYTIDNALSDRNSVAFRAALKATQPGSRLVSGRVSSIYPFTTADDPNCLTKVGLVEFPSLNEAVAKGLLTCPAFLSHL